MECVGHDADNRVRFPVNGDLLAHGSAISGVTTLPKRVADNGHALASRHVFAPFEQSAGGRLDSEDAEQSIGDLKSEHRFGIAIAGKCHRRKAVCGHVFKCAIRGGPVLKVRVRENSEGVALFDFETRNIGFEQAVLLRRSAPGCSGPNGRIRSCQTSIAGFSAVRVGGHRSGDVSSVYRTGGLIAIYHAYVSRHKLH